MDYNDTVRGAAMLRHGQQPNMGAPAEFQPAKLVVALLYRSRVVLRQATDLLAIEFGAADLCSVPLRFSFTDYYRAEMGTGLYKVLLAFRELISPDRLAATKLMTNTLERQLSQGLNRRQVNLDPGLVSRGGFTLATTKAADHRIALKTGIYGELTLHFHHGAFQPLLWTYPDYKTAELRAFLHIVRDRYLNRWPKLCCPPS